MTAPLTVPGLTTPVRLKKVRTAERTLASGLRVVVVRRPTVPVVEVRLRVPFFSTKPGHLARTTLLSGTMLTGTADHTRQELAIALGGLGADLGVSIDPDRLVMSASAVATGMPALLGLMAEVLTSASYPKNEVDGERARMLERITMARSQAGVIAAEALAQRIAPGHPYGQTLPPVEDVSAVTAAQLRRLHRDLVVPDGAILVIVGDLAPGRALDAVESALAGWTGIAPKNKPLPLPALRPQPLLIVDRPGSVQTSFRLGGESVTRTDPRWPAMQLANLAFGGYFSSRWVENIRESKGYSYSPRSAVEHSTLGSSFSVVADVATGVTAPAVLETMYELGRIATLPISDTELESVRQYAIGTLALGTATQSGLASTITGLLAVGLDVEWLTSHPARLLAVTADDVAEVAMEYLSPRRLTGVAVGDAAAITAPLAAVTEVE